MLAETAGHFSSLTHQSLLCAIIGEEYGVDVQIRK